MRYVADESEDDGVETSTDDIVGLYTMFKLQGAEMLAKLKVKYDVVSHNATKVEDNVYTWDLLDLIITYIHYLTINSSKNRPGKGFPASL